MIIGVVFMTLPLVTPYYNKKNIKSKFIENKKSDKNRNELFERIKLFINTIFSYKLAFEVFIILEIIILVFVFIIIYNITCNILVSLLFGIVFLIIPVIFLKIKLHIKRVEGSYEGEKFIIELLGQYKMNYFNIVDAMDNTAKNLNEQPVIKKALVKICYRIKEYNNSEELLKIIHEFTYAVDTSWSILLGNCIFLAIEHNQDITLALEDILEEIREIKTLIEKDKQFNNESFVLIKYILPGSYILSMISAIKFFGFSFTKLIYYQLHTSIGLKIFTIIIFLLITNLIIFLVLKKPKYDL
jgi:hypothetical protein